MKQVLNSKDKVEVKQTKTALAKKLGVFHGMLYCQHKKPQEDENTRGKIIRCLPNIRHMVTGELSWSCN